MSNYVPPEVTIAEEAAPPQISPIIASPSDVLLVGPTQGYQTRQETVTLTTPGTQIPLPFLASLNANVASSAKLISVVSVTNYLKPTPEEYKLTTDYTVNTSTNSIGIAASGSSIPNNTLVLVTYKWIPSSYFFPQRFTDIGSISQMYGPAFDTTGSKINSPLTFAASLALSNGSGSVILQPLFKNESDPPGPTTPKLQPTAEQIAEQITWSDSLSLAKGLVENVDVVVPIIGQSMEGVTDSVQFQIYQSTQAFLQQFNQEQVYSLAIFGDDSSASTERGQMAKIRENATTLKGSYGGKLNQQMVYLNTSNFQVALPNPSGTAARYLSVGGQYMAAAIAGAIASRPVSASMTRKGVGGFTAVLDQRSLADKNIDGGLGLFVVEQIGGNIRCRHAITLDTSSAARNEVSVVRAKFNMISSIRETLENQIIGQIIADAHSPFVVRSAIVGVLSALQSAGSILDYSAVKAEISAINPTTIRASFSYRPAFTLNYIEIVFSLNLSAQTVEVETGNTSTL
jgi:hypothetical protein